MIIIYISRRVPVRGKLFSEEGEDELLHLLVRLCDQVSAGRLRLHSLVLSLVGLAGHLGRETGVPSTRGAVSVNTASPSPPSGPLPALLGSTLPRPWLHPI